MPKTNQPAYADARSLVLNTDSLVPDEREEDPERAWQRARKWTRVTHLVVAGLLLDYEGCMLEKEDLRLLQEVAAAADSFAGHYDRLRQAGPPQPVIAGTRKAVA